jgi:hypothetical protein
MLLPDIRQPRLCIKRPGGRRLGCDRVATVTAGMPTATTPLRSTEEKGHAQRDQQERTDEVEQTDGDEAKVLGEAE